MSGKTLCSLCHDEESQIETNIRKINPFPCRNLETTGKMKWFIIMCAVNIDAINYLMITYDYVIKLLKLYN